MDDVSMLTTEDFLAMMDKMSNGERLKLLQALYEKHFDVGIPNDIKDKFAEFLESEGY